MLTLLYHVTAAVAVFAALNHGGMGVVGLGVRTAP